MFSTLRKLSIVAVLFICTSCSKHDWLLGTWRIDQPYTESHNKFGAKDKSVIGVGFKMIYEFFQDAKLVITKDTMTILKDGSSVSSSYKITERLESGAVKIETERNTSIYSIENGYLVIQALPGDISEAKIYFRKTN